MPESENESTQITTKAQLQSCGLGLSITRLAWTKLMAYCRATNLEVSGFMLMERDGDLLWIDEVYLLPQECTGTSTEMDRTAIAKFQLDLYKKGIIGKKDSKKRLAHFHTHCTFGVFWSGTDMEMRRLNSQGVDYFVSLVINHKGDALAAIDINGEFPMSINDLPIEIVDNDDTAELIKACKAEVEAKVKRPSSSWESTYGRTGRTYYNPETHEWQEVIPGKASEPERLELTSGPAPGQTNHGNSKSCYCGAVTPTWISREGCAVCKPSSDKPAAEAASKAVEQLRLLGPGDRRSRKAIKNLERLTKKMAARAGKQSYEDWKKDQARLDAARQAVHLASAGRISKPAGIISGMDDITIVEDSVPDDGILMSDEKGTWENVGGEIVKVDDASQIIYD